VAVIMPTLEGLQRVRPVWIKVGRVYGFSRLEMFQRVQLPAAMPLVASGIKLAVTYSILGVVASELILSSQGLGHLISFYFNNFAVTEMWATIIIVLFVAMSLNRAASWATAHSRFNV
jgi:NitT/TauT family transport system permease protein